MAIGEDVVFAGSGPAVTRMRLQVMRMAPHFRVALLVGERGTGVETVARRMHSMSAVWAQHFVEISATDFAVGEEPAVGGVIFLTGLEVLERQAQGEFLRRLNLALRESRVVVASEADPRGMIATGRLRAELYERVGTLEIRVAPLRERIEDLPVLLGGIAFGEEAMARLEGYGWPGNLTELLELKARVGGLGRVVECGDLGLAEEVVEKVVRLDKVIERHVVRVLERVGGNKLRAAEMLGISRSTLYRMLEGVGV